GPVVGVGVREVERAGGQVDEGLDGAVAPIDAQRQHVAAIGVGQGAAQRYALALVNDIGRQLQVADLGGGVLVDHVHVVAVAGKVIDREGMPLAVARDQLDGVVIVGHVLKEAGGSGLVVNDVKRRS